jgi:hypothetical protein
MVQFLQQQFREGVKRGGEEEEEEEEEPKKMCPTQRSDVQTD